MWLKIIYAVTDREENIERKGEKAGYYHFFQGR